MSIVAQSRLSSSVDIKIKIVPAASSLISTEYPSSNVKSIRPNIENKEVLVEIKERNHSNMTNQNNSSENIKIMNSQKKLLVCANIGDEIELTNISKYESLHFLYPKITTDEEFRSEPSITIIY